MDLHHLRYFVAVAERLHFAEAAEFIHVSQPGLSQQIKALEQELGFPLFHRTKQRVPLLDAGHVLLPYRMPIPQQNKTASGSKR